MPKKDDKDSSKRKSTRKNITRNIIKLGSSLAITFPRDFLQSFRYQNGDMKSIKDVKVHAYKVDPGSIIIRKTKAESEVQILDLNVSDFPIDLLENLLISARKLNINKVNIIYEEQDYEKCLEIVNKFGPPIHDDGVMSLDLSRHYRPQKFQDQIVGMIKNFSKIIENIVDDSEITENKKRSINTYLNSINSSFNEALRVLIIQLRNFYVYSEDHEENGTGTHNIINTLGNRVLISHIKNISTSAANLFYTKETDDIQVYLENIEMFPDFLDKEIDLVLSKDLSERVSEINELRQVMERSREEFKESIPDEPERYSVTDEVISTTVNFIYDSLFDILNLILTRWIENSVNIE